MYICIHVYTYICIHVYKHVYMYICNIHIYTIFSYMYTCTYVYMHIYTYSDSTCRVPCQSSKGQSSKYLPDVQNIYPKFKIFTRVQTALAEWHAKAQKATVQNIYPKFKIFTRVHTALAEWHAKAQKARAPAVHVYARMCMHMYVHIVHMHVCVCMYTQYTCTHVYNVCTPCR